MAALPGTARNLLATFSLCFLLISASAQQSQQESQQLGQAHWSDNIFGIDSVCEGAIGAQVASVNASLAALAYLAKNAAILLEFPSCLVSFSDERG